MKTSFKNTLETIDEAYDCEERRQCNVCGVRFTSYIMQVSHFQGRDHKREVAEWERAGKPERCCSAVPAPTHECTTCGLVFPSEAQYKSHMAGKFHRKNVELVKRGLEPEKKPQKKDNYYAKWDKQPAWVQAQARPGGCLEKALRQHTRNERKRKRNGSAFSVCGHAHSVPACNHMPIPLIDVSSASSSSPSPSPYDGGYQSPQSSPDCNNMQLKPQMQTNARQWRQTPQNRTSGSCGYAHQQQQQHVRLMQPNTLIGSSMSMPMLPMLPTIPATSSFNNLNLLNYAQQQQFALASMNMAHLTQLSAPNQQIMCVPINPFAR